MKRPPRAAHESILSRDLRGDIITFGLLIGIGCLVLFWLYQGSGLAKAQTITFTALVFFELVRLQTIRSEYKVGWFSNIWLVLAVVFSVILQLCTIYTPMNAWFKTVPLQLMDWVVIVVASVILLGVYKLVRYVIHRVWKKEEA